MTTSLKPAKPLPLVACGLVPAALIRAASCGGEVQAPEETTVIGTVTFQATWTHVSVADAVWRQIASTATLIDPILRPSYLPPDLTQLRLNADVGTYYFSVTYADATQDKWIHLMAGPVSNPAMAGPRSQQQQVVVRNARATYQLQDQQEPMGDAWLLWEEPGKVGAPGDPSLPNLDHVTYCLSSRGFSKEDLVRVAESLQPVE